MSHSYAKGISARDLINELEKAGFVQPSDRSTIEKFIISRQQDKQEALSLYMQILIGIGAFIFSCCAIGVIQLCVVHPRSGQAFLLWGVIFVGIAILLARVSSNKNKSQTKRIFVLQLSFYSMASGKLLFVIGSMMSLNLSSQWEITVPVLFITIATYYFYPVVVDRFVSTLASLILLLVSITSSNCSVGMQEVVLDIFIAIHVGLIYMLFMSSSRMKADYRPIAYAAVFSLAANAIFISTIDSDQYITPYSDKGQLYSLLFTNAILALALIGLIWRTASRIDKQFQYRKSLVLASLGAILLGATSVPGVVLAICLMILGYAKYEKYLWVIGMLFMPLFISLYYYELNTTLLIKSGILVGSGAILLMGWRYLVAQKLGKEVQA